MYLLYDTLQYPRILLGTLTKLLYNYDTVICTGELIF